MWTGACPFPTMFRALMSRASPSRAWRVVVSAYVSLALRSLARAVIEHALLEVRSPLLIQRRAT